MTEAKGRTETVKLEQTLLVTAEAGKQMCRDLIDLDELAYAQAVGEPVEVRAKGKQHWYLTDTGDPRAKRALKDLHATATAHLRAINDARNLFLGGPGSNAGLRGSLLGADDGSGAQSELERLKAAQARRRARGEYVPTATELQPNVPGARRR